MKNLKIRARMLVSYMIIIALLLVIGITSIVMLNRVSNSLEDFYDQEFQTVESSLTFLQTIFSARSDILSSLLDEDPTTTANFISSAESQYNSLYTLVEETRKTYQGDLSQLDSIKQSLDTGKPYLTEILNLAQQNRRDEAYSMVKNQFRPVLEEVRQLAVAISDSADLTAAEKVEDARNLARVADVLIIVLLIVSVAISFFLAALISNSIRQPVAGMCEVAQHISGGNMDTNITYESNDEIGEMASYMRSMAGNMKTLISDIGHCMSEMSSGNFTVNSRAREVYTGDYSAILQSMRSLRDNMASTLQQIDNAADQVNSGSEQVSSSAQALAQGATQQASSVEELAGTINDVSHQVETTAELARTAKVENAESHKQIELCSKDMDELMHAMNKIEDRSQEISKIIKTIEDIAFQTNILALNAAVEAARAGSAGKGFAVVADEVRNLASKSAEASKNTARLIEDTIAAVGEGTSLSQQTNQALQSVVDSAENVLNAVNQISEATDRQASAISQISIAVDQISSVVQTNSATSQESAAASEELSSQANILKGLIRKFTLGESEFQQPVSSPKMPSVPKKEHEMSNFSASYSDNDKY